MAITPPHLIEGCVTPTFTTQQLLEFRFWHAIIVASNCTIRSPIQKMRLAINSSGVTLEQWTKRDELRLILLVCATPLYTERYM